MPGDKSKLIYSTDKVIPRKEKVLHNTPLNSQQKISVRLERKGRGGKSVTLVEGLPLSGKELETILKQCKTQLGTGGALKKSSIEIQGDHCGAVISILQEKGFKPKRSGG